MGLNERQKKFCEFYAKSGNAVKSYTDAGYDAKSEAGARASCSKLLTNANIRQYMATLEESMRSEAIADITEVKEFWTKALRNDEEEMPHRLKASEFLIKSSGGFIEKQEIKSDVVSTTVNIIEDKQAI